MSAAPAAEPGARVGALFEEHGRMVLALCRMLLRSREEAEDAAQQTFLLAHRSLLDGFVPERPEGWLATIARHECYRRLGRRPPAAVPLQDADGGGGDDPSGVVDLREEIEVLCGAVADLPAGQRQAVVLREFYGLSYREVAAVLGVSGAAVESLLFKGRRRLQDRLRPVRAASGALVLPAALRDALAEAIPGFAGGGAGAAAAGGVLVKLGSVPLAAKVAAVVVAGTGTTVTVAEVRESRVAPRAAVERRAEPATPAPLLVAAADPPRARPVSRRAAVAPPAPVADDGRDDTDEPERETLGAADTRDGGDTRDGDVRAAGETRDGDEARDGDSRRGREAGDTDDSGERAPSGSGRSGGDDTVDAPDAEEETAEADDAADGEDE